MPSEGRAPGRVNLIGEHTDYNEGFVLPAAIDYYTWVAAAGRDDRRLNVIAQDMGQQRVSIELDHPMVKDPQAPWSDYVRGVVQALQKRRFTLSGADLLLRGNVPQGAGLSSSASLEMALVRALTHLSDEAITPEEAALAGQAAENHFVGCNCGIMDQLVSAVGKTSSALLIDCRDLSSEPVPMPRNWELLIVDSGIRRGLVDSEYNRRRQQCEAAAQHFGRASLRDDFAITTPAIDQLVKLMADAGQGQVGVRMTGDGFGGCVVAVAPSDVIPVLTEAVLRQYQSATGYQPRLIRARASAGAYAD